MQDQDNEHPGEAVKFFVFNAVLTHCIQNNLSHINPSDEDLIYFYVQLAIDEVKEQLGQKV